MAEVEVVTCETCGGEFDSAEWSASPTCPECEQPKRVRSRRRFSLQQQEPTP